MGLPAGPSDRELWQRAARGDSGAFGELFDRHATAVYNHLFRRTANWSEAEDLTSAVFLLAWRRRGKVVIDRESVRPWLLGVASHVLRNSARARRRYLAALARVVPADEAAADHADAVAAAVDLERSMAGLRRAVAGLPPREREVVELCAWSGLDQKAAAVALGVSVGTVKSRMHRARRRLARSLGEPGGARPPVPPGAAAAAADRSASPRCPQEAP
ncbi:MAG TPA: RNA polymerase sigma factor [Streptosporangiaceae bacterium]|nr:RNA polymerase sigma factor [Streptosporangiaceae bacterium]